MMPRRTNALPDLYLKQTGDRPGQAGHEKPMRARRQPLFAIPMMITRAAWTPGGFHDRLWCCARSLPRDTYGPARLGITPLTRFPLGLIRGLSALPPVCAFDEGGMQEGRCCGWTRIGALWSVWTGQWPPLPRCAGRGGR